MNYKINGRVPITFVGNNISNVSNGIRFSCEVFLFYNKTEAEEQGKKSLKIKRVPISFGWYDRISSNNAQFYIFVHAIVSLGIHERNKATSTVRRGHMFIYRN